MGMKNKKNAVVLLGPPGSGKSSLAEKLREHLDGKIVATGLLLKKMAGENTGEGQKIKRYLERGELVPTGIVTEAIIQILRNDDARWILFDGFPRQKDQIVPFFAIGAKMTYELRAVFHLEIPRSVAFERITGRRVCTGCGDVYHISGRPPSQAGFCDLCGGKLVQRKDDSPEVLKERFEEFQQNTLPVINYFQRKCPDMTFRLRAEKELSDMARSALAILHEKDEK